MLCLLRSGFAQNVHQTTAAEVISQILQLAITIYIFISCHSSHYNVQITQWWDLCVAVLKQFHTLLSLVTHWKDFSIFFQELSGWTRRRAAFFPPPAALGQQAPDPCVQLHGHSTVRGSEPTSTDTVSLRHALLHRFAWCSCLSLLTYWCSDVRGELLAAVSFLKASHFQHSVALCLLTQTCMDIIKWGSKKISQPAHQIWHLI